VAKEVILQADRGRAMSITARVRVGLVIVAVLACLVPASADADPIAIGVVSFDRFILGDGESPGVADFSVFNFN
jgi:hypothetical protein